MLEEGRVDLGDVVVGDYISLSACAALVILSQGAARLSTRLANCMRYPICGCECKKHIYMNLKWIMVLTSLLELADLCSSLTALIAAFLWTSCDKSIEKYYNLLHGKKD